jgi:hypothetical protein
MKRKQIRALIGGLSFGTALFVFQACYGMPQDWQDDVFIEGKVVSFSNRLPVKGIMVASDLHGHLGITDSLGKFAFYTPWANSLRLTIEDTDPGSDGDYLSKDTVLVDPSYQVYLNIAIEER